MGTVLHGLERLCNFLRTSTSGHPDQDDYVPMSEVQEAFTRLQEGLTRLGPSVTDKEMANTTRAEQELRMDDMRQRQYNLERNQEATLNEYSDIQVR